MKYFNPLLHIVGKVWEFLKSTLFSKKWWDKYYWIPVAFLVGLILWILSGGKTKPPAEVFRKMRDRDNQEAESIAKHEKEAEEKDAEIEEEAKKKEEEIKEEAAQKISDAAKDIEEENKKIKNDSKAVNDLLNDLVE
tara:strand:- start:617 stop:1027 length:411 start_codon:yes stop_codon:yes gene_type:complete